LLKPGSKQNPGQASFETVEYGGLQARKDHSPPSAHLDWNNLSIDYFNIPNPSRENNTGEKPLNYVET